MSYQYGTEVYERAFPDHEESYHRPAIRGYLSYGLHFPQACAKHVEDTFRASKEYIIISASLAKDTTAVKDLKCALGDKVVGEPIGMTSQTLWSECVDVTNECRRLSIDLLVALGGGSVVDAAKFGGLEPSRTEETINPPVIPIISVPTTTAGAEFTNLAGGTDDATGRKHQFSAPLRDPELVILDPNLSLATPDRYWLTGGGRAVDHCIEVLCSLDSNDAADADAILGLRALIPGLLRCKADRAGLDARYLCQIGAKFSISAPCRVPKPVIGASHAIGHALGPMGVGQGDASCILLPAVCKYNVPKGANVDRQKKALDGLWTIPEVKEFDFDQHNADLGMFWTRSSAL